MLGNLTDSACCVGVPAGQGIVQTMCDQVGMVAYLVRKDGVASKVCRLVKVVVKLRSGVIPTGGGGGMGGGGGWGGGEGGLGGGGGGGAGLK